MQRWRGIHISFIIPAKKFVASPTLSYGSLPPPPPAPCSSGWSRKSCYGNIDFPTLEWSDARRHCQKLVGDLAKIISAAENQFIYTLIQKQKKYIMGSGWNFTLRQTTSFTGQTTVRSLAIPYGPPINQTIHPVSSVATCWGPQIAEDAIGTTQNVAWIDKSNIEQAPVILCQKTPK